MNSNNVAQPWGLVLIFNHASRLHLSSVHLVNPLLFANSVIFWSLEEIKIVWSVCLCPSVCLPIVFLPFTPSRISFLHLGNFAHSLQNGRHVFKLQVLWNVKVWCVGRRNLSCTLSPNEADRAVCCAWAAAEHMGAFPFAGFSVKLRTG